MELSDAANEPPHSAGNDEGPAPFALGGATNTTKTASPHAPPSSFAQFSASTAAILERLQGKGGHASRSAALEAKRAEILQNYVTSDKLPTPPPMPSAGRRGRGGRVGAPSGLKSEAGASSGRAPGRGRGRARGSGGGRGRGRGGKRKRSESEEESDHDDDDSDLSSSYTPLPTRTKSGRSVNKPVAFVPTIPEPSQRVKRPRSAKTMLAAKCKTCHRETDPTNNRIVFCDACSTAYHQYCHTPPIDNDVVTVLEKAWLCNPCIQSKQQPVVARVQDLVAADRLSIEEKRAYFNTLTQQQLVDLLVTATIHHPELPIFPPHVNLLNSRTIMSHNQQPPTVPPLPPFPQSQTQYQPPSAFHHSSFVTSPPNMHPPPGQTPQSNNFSSRSETHAAEARVLDEYPSQAPGQAHPRTTIDLAGNQYDEDDGYDTDPPAHYPKPGNGLARTLRPESEDLNWLVDDNFEVFSHGWKGDGTGLGADGTLDGMSSGTKVV
ncbi:hypothetical protein J1614_006313 [Plenodomus biglobosus]|nr:hypothetical protein J1614_006313 [Plenodomus biglobosus]